MKNLEWTTIDKSGWADGEWKNEPDKVQFSDETTGLPCLIVRGPSGALCGYVGVTQGHPFYERDYDDCRHECLKTDPDDSYGEWIDVHGGLTFANKCRPNEDESKGICHTVESGEDDNVWWLGFDCAHADDYSPMHSGRKEACFQRHSSEIYRTVSYVRGQCEHLAKQLMAVAE